MNTTELGLDEKRNLIEVLFTEYSVMNFTNAGDEKYFFDWNENLSQIYN
ncbi:MAG: hypothetical protein K1060chlam5_00304 [Candidatus Anoxychlamydiales bacterium]|nr:hypothetical protein [Candidatus Anoxychlamydiales bacterium]